MSNIINVQDFSWHPGQNDAEYIQLLKDALDRQKTITNKALNKIKQLSKMPTIETVALDEKVTASYYDDEFEEWSLKTATIRDILNSVCEDYTILQQLSSNIKPGSKAMLLEKRYGRWIDYPDEEYFANCSECGYQMDVHTERGYFHFCPNCGADMSMEEN